MQVKYLPLIKLLFENDNWNTAKNISDNLKVSVRTVKNYVSELNSEFPGIIQSSNNGYRIDTHIAGMALKETRKSIPQTSRERCAYIINKIIRCERNSQELSSYDLCEELFISPTTLRSVFPRIRKLLSEFDLILTVSGEKLLIEGSERNKRKVLSHLIYKEANENFVNLDTIQRAFPEINILLIRDTVLDVLSENQYFINDYSLSNFVLHIAITIDRIRSGSYTSIDNDVESNVEVRGHVYNIIDNLIKRLETDFEVKFSNAEVQELTLLLISRATTLKYRNITIDNLKDYVGSDCLELVDQMIDDINAFLYVNLRDPEFMIRFSLHIKNLLIRAKNEKFNRNPMGNAIKSSCPLIYEHAVFCSELIREKTGLTINDDEIGYIAFHLGSTFEAQREIASKLSAVILSPNYYNSDTRLSDTIRERFSSELLITNIVRSENEIESSNKVDIIISTVPMNSIPDVAMVQVQPFLTENNISLIRQKIEDIKALRRRETFSKHLREIFRQELFEYGDGFSSKEDAIKAITARLKDEGYVNDGFMEEVLDRESMSSTGFGDFAIPHSLHMNAIKTGMYFYISKNPIPWDESEVKLIIMLCFRRDERYIFNQIFDPLTMVLTDASVIKSITDIKDYDKLVEYLCGCIM